MSDIKKYISNEILDNIFSEYSNVFAIEMDMDGILDNKKMVGQLKLGINLIKTPYIQNEDFVEFSLKKIKWRSKIINDKLIILINPYWVKLYNHDPKLKVVVPILRSKPSKISSKRDYFNDFEATELTYKQYQQKRILKDFGDKYTYRQMEAYYNMSKRFREHGDYYRALNETSKTFCVEHAFIKEQIFPEINNSKQKYKKEWNNSLLKQYQKNENQKRINDFLKERKNNKQENTVVKGRF